MEMLWLQKMKNVTIHVDTRSTLSKAGLEHHKAMTPYTQCSGLLLTDGLVLTQSQACSPGDSSTSLKHNRSDRMTTSPKTLLTMVSTADFGWYLNYNAVAFSM